MKNEKQQPLSKNSCRANERWATYEVSATATADLRYEVIEEDRILDGLQYRSYGIAVYAKSNADGSIKVIQTIHDITTNRARLCALVKQCNLLGLSLLHLNDVIEDYLAN